MSERDVEAIVNRVLSRLGRSPSGAAPASPAPAVSHASRRRPTSASASGRPIASSDPASAGRPPGSRTSASSLAFWPTGNVSAGGVTRTLPPAAGFWFCAEAAAAARASARAMKERERSTTVYLGLRERRGRGVYALGVSMRQDLADARAEDVAPM